MCDANDIKWIGESSLRKNYERLYLFYQKVWAQPHDYVVMNARRCFNLNYLFAQVHKADRKPVANAGKIISNNALLLYNSKIAEHYRACGRFPRILIVDDLILHGRGVAKLLYDLEELIISRLSLSQEMTKDERYYIRRNLADAIDIFIFAANRQPLLIDDIYLRKLQWEVQLYTREIRSLSQQFSSFLQRADVPNTSYVLSYQVKKMPNPGEKWLCQHWNYRGAKQRMYFSCEPQAVDVKFLPTVRLRESFSQKTNSEIWLTSLTLFGELPCDSLSGICRMVEGKLASSEFCHIRSILQKDQKLIRKQQAQFLSFVLSAIYLRDFLADCSVNAGFPLPPFSADNSDLHKIAQNFGKVSEIESELKKLITAPRLLEELRTILLDTLGDCAGVFLRKLEHGSDQKEYYVNFHLEDCFYNMGMAAEQSAYKTISLNRYQPNKRDFGTQPMEALLRWEQPALHFKYSKSLPTGTQKLSCMMALMDNGLMAMNFECAEQEQGDVIYSSLKVGELATLSIPRRLHLFIPALALVEADCWRAGLEPKNAVKQFLQTLPGKVSPDERRESSDAQLKEESALAFLKTQGSDFVDLLYDCGQSFNGWDIDLITSDDWLEEGSSSYLTFVRQEEEGQEFYLERARRFLNRI